MNKKEDEMYKELKTLEDRVREKEFEIERHL